MDDLLHPIDAAHPLGDECREIRELMLEAAERKLSDFENRRIERHISECPVCAEVLAEGDDLAAGQFSVELPSEQEWNEVQDRIWSELELPPVGARAPEDPVTTSAAPVAQTTELDEARNVRWWQPLLPLAACLALTYLVIRNLGPTPVSLDELPPDDDVIAAEVLELSDDQDYLIFTGDDEDGVLILMTTNG